MIYLIVVGASIGYIVIGLVVSAVIAAMLTDSDGDAIAPAVVVGGVLWPLAGFVPLGWGICRFVMVTIVPLWLKGVRRMNPNFKRLY